LNSVYFKEGLSLLKNNEILCIFPEGVINPRKYGFMLFKKSYLFFAMKTKSDILPIYIYPEIKPFKKSLIVIGELVTADEYLKKGDSESINGYFLGCIMDCSTDESNA
jgi:hypothetical protein